MGSNTYQAIVIARNFSSPSTVGCKSIAGSVHTGGELVPLGMAIKPLHTDSIEVLGNGKTMLVIRWHFITDSSF